MVQQSQEKLMHQNYKYATIEGGSTIRSVGMLSRKIVTMAVSCTGKVLKTTLACNANNPTIFIAH